MGKNIPDEILHFVQDDSLALLLSYSRTFLLHKHNLLRLHPVGALQADEVDPRTDTARIPDGGVLARAHLPMR